MIYSDLYKSLKDRTVNSLRSRFNDNNISNSIIFQ